MVESPPNWSKANDDTPYDELDAPVVGLCRILNDLPGIWTTESCGGHEGGGPDVEGGFAFGALPANEWGINIRPELEDWRPTFDGWLSLEFVAWAVHDVAKAKAVRMEAWSTPPWLNDRAHMLIFDIDGWRDGEGGITPDELAAFIARFDREIYRVGGSDDA
jgi:hypothetical protein